MVWGANRWLVLGRLSDEGFGCWGVCRALCLRFTVWGSGLRALVFGFSGWASGLRGGRYIEWIYDLPPLDSIPAQLNLVPYTPT